MKCKVKVPLVDPKNFVSKGNVAMCKGKCSKCGTNVVAVGTHEEVKDENY